MTVENKEKKNDETAGVMSIIDSLDRGSSVVLEERIQNLKALLSAREDQRVETLQAQFKELQKKVSYVDAYIDALKALLSVKDQEVKKLQTLLNAKDQQIELLGKQNDSKISVSDENDDVPVLGVEESTADIL